MRYTHPPESPYQELMRQGSDLVHNHTCANLGQINLERLKHIPPGGSWRDIPFDLLPEGMKRARRSDHTRRYGRLHPEDVSGTVLTKCDPHWGSFFHYEQDRVISAREAARIQSLPITSLLLLCWLLKGKLNLAYLRKDFRSDLKQCC